MARRAASNRFLTGTRFSNSLFFNNVSSGGVIIGNQSLLNPTSTVTLEAWIYPTTLANAMVFFDNSSNGVTNSYYFDMTAGGTLRLFITVGGVSTSAVFTNPLALNQWNFINVTYDGTNIRLFNNGVADPTVKATGGGSIGTNAGSLRIGQYWNGTVGTSNMYMTGVKIYSAAFVLQDHKDRYYSNIQKSTGLVLEYLMASQGATVTDTSGNGFTGTYTTNTWSSTLIPFKARTAATGRVAASGRVAA